MFASSDAVAFPAALSPARQVAYAFAASTLLALVVLYIASGSSLSVPPFAFSRTSDLSLGRAAAVPGDYRAVAFEVGLDSSGGIGMSDIDRSWTCEICGQSLFRPAGSTKTILPPGYFQNCKLRDHMIGDECIAYRDLPKAKSLVGHRT